MSTRAVSSPGRGTGRDVVHVFEPNAVSFPDLSEYTSDLLARRTFIKELATAEIRGQQASTILGELWALVDPLFQAGIYYFLFVVIRGGSGGANSTAYVTAIIGSVFLFNYTRIAIADGGRSILRHRGLVLNAIFPRALVPISEVYKGFIATLPAFAVYAIAHLIAQAPISQALLLLPYLLLVQTVINLGFAFLFSTLTVYIKDMATLLQYILRILMFATPVIYPVSTLPPNIATILSWNPLFALFSSYQEIITGQMPTASQLFQATAWAVAVFVLGAWMFLRRERTFALHI